MNKNSSQATIEEFWRDYLTNGASDFETTFRHFFRWLPHDPRCKTCGAPFQGVGGLITRTVLGRKPSNLNPKLCDMCEMFMKKHQGGAEIELSLLFADVRGSTNLAEGMSPKDFSKLINRFYNTASGVMVRTDALIDKIIGDQAAGMYVPGFAGQQHARRAVQAAQEILRATGHADPAGPWIPLGVGVHTGLAFVGSVGSETGTSDITVLGDAPNTAARLSSNAGAGEILISDAALSASGLDLGDLEVRQLTLKGKSQPFQVHVLTNLD